MKKKNIIIQKSIYIDQYVYMQRLTNCRYILHTQKNVKVKHCQE